MPAVSESAGLVLRTRTHHTSKAIHGPCTCRASLDRWPFEMPAGRILIGVASSEDGGFVESAADDLKPRWHAVGREAAGQGKRGMTAHVERRRVAQAGGD